MLLSALGCCISVFCHCVLHMLRSHSVALHLPPTFPQHVGNISLSLCLTTALIPTLSASKSYFQSRPTLIYVTKAHLLEQICLLHKFIHNDPVLKSVFSETELLLSTCWQLLSLQSTLIPSWQLQYKYALLYISYWTTHDLNSAFLQWQDMRRDGWG